MCIVMLSNRLSKLCLAAGLLALAGLVCWFATSRTFHRNVAYQGKSLGYWFNQLPMTSLEVIQGHEKVVQCAGKRARHMKSAAVQEYGSWVEQPETSKKAIQAIGNDGLDFYLSEVRQQPAGALQWKTQKAAFAIGLAVFRARRRARAVRV